MGKNKQCIGLTPFLNAAFMWHIFFKHFGISLICFGLLWWKGGRKPLAEALIIATAFALSLSVPQIVCGYIPELDRGWKSYVIVAVIAAAISVPFSFVLVNMQRRKQKRDEGA